MVKTTQNTNAVVATKVAALVAAGADPVDALRTVCGATVVDTMIGEVYDALRSAAEKELVMRETASAHLNGLPARQNANAIEGLCDTLTNLHIAQMEGGR